MRLNSKLIYSVVAVMVIGCIYYLAILVRKPSALPNSRNSESLAVNEEDTGLGELQKESSLPLNEEEKKKLAKAMEERAIDVKKPAEVYSLGEIEVREVYNTDFVWTKDLLHEAMADGQLTYIPIRRLDFFNKKTRQLVAQFKLNALDSLCNPKIELVNLDVTTPWPEIVYFCMSDGMAMAADMFVMSVTKDLKVTLNKQFLSRDFESIIKIETSGSMQAAKAQNNEKFLKSAFKSEFYFVDRKTGRVAEERPFSETPVYYAFQMLGSGSLYHCNQCTLHPYSVVSLENGVWKDANSELGAQKFFTNSIRGLNAEINEIKKGKFSENEKSFELKSMNELLFLKLAHSIRIGKAAEAWKEINENFNKSVYRGCSGKEEDCPAPDWRVQLKEELEERGFETKDLKI